MTRSEIEAFTERWLSAITSGNSSRFDELVAEEVLDSASGTATSREAFRARAAAITRAFDELSGAVTELLIEGDRIAWRWRLHGRHRAEFLGEPASSRRVRLDGVNFQRLARGAVIEHYTLFDVNGALAQLRARD